MHDDWGRSDNDQRHRVVLSGTAPTFKGVQFAYLFSYASAPPFNVQTGTDRNNDTNANDRPPGVGRNTGEGFDSATLDLRVSRSFTIRRPASSRSHRGRVQRAESVELPDSEQHLRTGHDAAAVVRPADSCG